MAWLPSGSAEAVRAVLAEIAPELAREAIVLGPRILGNPRPYWRGTARVGDQFVAKFAWSAEAAVGVDRELSVLQLLPELAPSLPVPEVVVASRQPLLFVSRYVPGVPVSGPYADDTTRSMIPEQLAAALASLHDPVLKRRLEDHGVSMGVTEPQATTNALRERFVGPVVGDERAARVLSWCDWIDDVQSRPVREATVVHGDLHGHNLVVSEDGQQLRLVADFEQVATGDPHFDFRYLVSIRRDLDWFNACLSAYQRLSGRELSIERILGWHIRTALGDALWRTERGVPLPGDLTPDEYVDDITWRLLELGVAP